MQPEFSNNKICVLTSMITWILWKFELLETNLTSIQFDVENFLTLWLPCFNHKSYEIKENNKNFNINLFIYLLIKRKNAAWDY